MNQTVQYPETVKITGYLLNLHNVPGLHKRKKTKTLLSTYLS
jgi:hypothetical protein